MVGSAKTAIRNKHVARLPRLKPSPGSSSTSCAWRSAALIPSTATWISATSRIPRSSRSQETWLGKTFRPAFQTKREKPYGAFNNVMNK